jgi:phosphate transport system substrate-binding protein
MNSIINRVLAGSFLLPALLLFLLSCTSYEEDQKKWPDTYNRGTIHISADESFKPVIDQQTHVYDSNQPDTRIIVHYKPEAECLKDLAVDSIRMIIVTRGYSPSEDRFLYDSMKVEHSDLVIAKDAIAVIVNPDSPDSLLTMTELKQVLTGKFKRKLIPVFDGVKATSTVRFIVDSVLHNDSLSPNTVAARTSEGVIDYVAKTPDAIGFIGVSWVGNQEDSTQMNFLKKVKMVYLESTDNPGGYVLPYQANIYTHRYPLVRDLVYILKENHKGLGTGFSDFLRGNIGQLIFKRAYLVPVQGNFILRQVQLNE